MSPNESKETKLLLIFIGVHKRPPVDEIASTSMMMWDVSIVTCYPTRSQNGVHVTHQV